MKLNQAHRKSKGSALALIAGGSVSFLVIAGIGIYVLQQLLGGGVELRNAHDSGMLAVAKKAPTLSVGMKGEELEYFSPILGTDRVTLSTFNQLYAYTYIVEVLANKDNSGGSQKANARRVANALFSVADKLNVELAQASGSGKTLLTEAGVFNTSNSVRMLKSPDKVRSTSDLQPDEKTFKTAYADRTDGFTQIQVSKDLLGEIINPADVGSSNGKTYLRGYKASSASGSLPKIQGAVVNPGLQPRLLSNSFFTTANMQAPGGIKAPVNSFQSVTSVSQLLKQDGLKAKTQSSSVVGVAPTVMQVGAPPVPPQVRYGYLQFTNPPGATFSRSAGGGGGVRVNYNNIFNYTQIKDTNYPSRFSPVFAKGIPGLGIVLGRGGQRVGIITFVTPGTGDWAKYLAWVQPWILHNKDPENNPAPPRIPPMSTDGLPLVLFAAGRGPDDIFFFETLFGPGDISVCKWYTDSDFLDGSANFAVRIFKNRVKAYNVTYSDSRPLTAGEYAKADTLASYADRVFQANGGGDTPGRINIDQPTGMRSWKGTLFNPDGGRAKKVLGKAPSGPGSKSNAFRFTADERPSLYDLMDQAGQSDLLEPKRSAKNLAYRLWLTNPEKFTLKQASDFLKSQSADRTIEMGEERFAYFDENASKLVWSPNRPTQWRRSRSSEADGAPVVLPGPDGTPGRTAKDGDKDLDVNTYLLDPSPDPDFNGNGDPTIRDGLDRDSEPSTVNNALRGGLNKINGQGSPLQTDWGVGNRLFDARTGTAIRTGRLSQAEAKVKLIWQAECRYGSGYNGNVAHITFSEDLDAKGTLSYQYPL